MVGVLTGADVVELSRPFPAGIDSPIPALRSGARGDALRGRARRRRGRAGPLPRGGRARADRGRVRAARASPRRRSRGRDRGMRVRPLVPLRRRRGRTRRRRPRRPRALPLPSLELHTGRVLRRRRRLERGRGLAHRVGELPGAVHAALRRRRCARASRLEAPPDHAAGLGRVVRHQVRRVRVRRAHGTRVAQARRARSLDRRSPRAPRRELVLERTGDARRGRVHLRRRPRRAALRRDRGRRRIRPRSRAGDALPHARLARRRVPRAERRGAKPGGPHEHDAERTEPRLRRPAALPGTRADDDHRGRPTRHGSRGAPTAQPRSHRRVPVPHTVRRAVRLGRLRGLPRRRARTLPVRRATRRGRDGAGRRTARRGRDRLRRRAVDLEHGLHHARRAGRRARPAEVRKRGGLLDHDLRTRRHHGAHGDDASGPGSPNGDRTGGCRPPRRGARGRRRAHRGRHGDLAMDDRVGQLLVALLRRRCRRGGRRSRPARREDRRDPRAPRRRERVAPARRRHGALEPRGTPGRNGAGARGDGLLRGAESPPARR